MFWEENAGAQRTGSQRHDEEKGPKQVQLGNWEIGNWLLGSSGSLWAIRAAMAVLAIGYAVQFQTGIRNSKWIAVLWCIGAALATYHTWTALSAFHGGSLAEAVESTARRTEAFFGVRVGAGVYVNYVFVVVWWLDAIWRWQAPQPRLRPVEIAIDLFLIVISFFGAVVFASGPIRYVGILAIAAWIWIYGKRRAQSRTAVPAVSGSAQSGPES